MMEEFLAGQEADLLMKRLEILQRRLLPTQEELQRGPEQATTARSRQLDRCCKPAMNSSSKGMEEEEMRRDGTV